MKTNNSDFIDFLHLLSYGAIYNFVDTVRNTGKTTKAKAWILARFLKRKKKCLWLRTFDVDIMQIKKDFYTGKNARALKILADWGYDVDPESITQNGDYIYYTDPKTGKKSWFIKLVYLAQAQSLKGNEIPDCDLIIFDEYRTKPSRLARYNGDMAKDFVDIVFSISRDHYVRSIMLGNKEMFNNPFFDFFGIKPLPEEFEGIRTFKQGSIAVMQSNKIPAAILNSEMTRKQMAALKGTSLFGYLYTGETAGVSREHIKRPPGNALYYNGFYVGGAEFCARIDYDGAIYFIDGLDDSRHVWTDRATGKYKFCTRIMRGDQKHFKKVLSCVKKNRVFFADVSAYEHAGELLRLLGV